MDRLDNIPAESVAVFSNANESISAFSAFDLIKAVGRITIRKIFWWRAIWGYVLPNFRSNSTDGQRTLSTVYFFTSYACLAVSIVTFLSIKTFTEFLVYAILAGAIPAATYIPIIGYRVVKFLATQTILQLQDFRKEIEAEVTKTKIASSTLKKALR